MSDNVRKFNKFLSNRDIPDSVKAAISKMQTDPHASINPRNNIRLPDSRVMAHVANTTIGNIRDARNLFQILPDMDYARQILIAATIAPGDLVDTKVLYSLANADVASNLSGPLLRKVQEFFDDTYRIGSLLYPILNDVIFETGAYPILIMPESSIDHIINSENYSGVSMEAAINALDSHIREQTQDGKYVPWGILGNPGSKTDVVDSYTGVSFESLTFQPNQYNDMVDLSTIKVSAESLYGHVEGESKEVLEGSARNLEKLIQSKDKTISVTDNMYILRNPMVVETKRQIAVSRIYGRKLRPERVSLESKAKHDGGDSKRAMRDIERSFYRQRNHKHIPVQPLSTRKQVGATTYGHPLVLHLPTESVIPIHVPGNPAEHVAYYVMLDADGNPISVADQTSYYDDIRSQMNNADSYASQMIQQARRGMEGMGGFHNEIIDELSRIHGEAVEADLLARLRAGVISGNYELGSTESHNRIMLARHLKGQKTTMLFVPAEMMTYIAFDYNEFGVGKSVLEDGKILGSIRAAIMLANTLATLNNAVGGKTIDITLDPDDENPAATVEFLLSEYAKVNSQGFTRIVGSTHPLGLADQIQNHGVNVQVSGNTRYPETRMEVNQREGTSRPIDTELEESYRRRHIQMFGLSPEMMEGLNSQDFATTIVQNNLMLLKKVVHNQEKLEPFLTAFVRRYILNSGILIEEFRELIRNNIDEIPEWIKEEAEDVKDQVDIFMEEFVSLIKVDLPSPEVGDINKTMQAFDAYSEALEKVIDAHLNEEMFASETSLGMEEMIPNIKAVTKAEFQRRWLRKYNVMSELDIFNSVTDDEEGPIFDLLDVTTEHLDGLNRSIAKYMDKLVEAAKKRSKDVGETLDNKGELDEIKEEAGIDGVAGDMAADDDFDLDMDGGVKEEADEEAEVDLDVEEESTAETPEADDEAEVE